MSHPYNGTNRAAVNITDYASAAAFLAAGRTARGKLTRPTRSTNTRIERRAEDAIAVLVHETDVVTYLADGRTFLSTGGWSSNLTRERLREFLPHGNGYVGQAREIVGGVNYGMGLAYFHDSNPRTPERITKCRRCHGTAVSPETILCWHHNCRHGEAPGHEHPDQSCRNCDWTGYCDYGSAPIPPQIGYGLWLDATGTPRPDWSGIGKPYRTVSIPPHPNAGPKPSYDTASAYKAPTTTLAHDYPSGARVTSDLRRLIPGLCGQATCPDCEERESVHDLVIHLNDRHRWTREQVADWLESLDVNLSFPIPETA